MVRYRTFLLVFCLLNSGKFCNCKRHRRHNAINSKEKDSLTGLFLSNITAVDLFSEMEAVNRVTHVDDVWKWKSKSGSLRVQENARLQILQSPISSLSLEFRLKLKKRGKTSLFHATSLNTNRESSTTWLEVLMDYGRSSFEVAYMSENMIPEMITLDLIGRHNTWIDFLITLDNGDQSTITLWTGVWPKQTRIISERISLAFPQNTQFEIGGRSSDAPTSFAGLIRMGRIIIPGVYGYPVNVEDTQRTSIHKKRGARRKPSLSDNADVTYHSERTRNIQRSHDDETTLESLQEEIRECREDGNEVSRMLQMLKKSHSDLQARVRYLESCQCKPACIAADGRHYNHDQTWRVNQCTSCRCTHGVISCENDTSCQDPSSECDSSPCVNNGNCIEVEDGYICQCRRGYRGRFCEEIDQCARSICKNAAPCELLPNNDYECQCPAGYMGKNCETLDWCARLPCLNRGTCTNLGQSYECRCQEGFMGDRCEQRDWCLNSPCLNGGECSQDHQSYECRCQPGYIGDRCERRDLCFRSPCLNGAECSQDGQRYECRCQPGYTGKRCERRDLCFNSPCLNGGQCTQDARRYECRCRPGYMGDRCERRDRCFRSPCLNGAECSQDGQRYICRCQPGYMGDRCERRDWCHSSPCLNGAECSQDGLGYTCRCRRGYVGDNCQYSDLCEASPCGDRGRCSNVFGTDDYHYQCDCDSGFSGTNCEERNHCSSNPCVNGGLCTSSDTSFECDCGDGYTGDRCEFRNRCFAEPCMNGATCISNGNGFKCLCVQDYSGTLCEHRDECASEPCLNGGRCYFESGGFRCRCRQQFYGNRCEFTDFCRAKPCFNNAACQNEPYSAEQPFTCDCVDGYVGPLCRTVDTCASNPCLHGGVCSVEGRRYTCDCPPQYGGERCQLLDYCSRNPCLNGGECRNEERGFVCTCPESHTGRRCESPHPCRGNPCRNGGQCSPNEDGGYTCACPPTHYGEDCSLVDACFRNPCLNGGNCMNVRGGFLCSCRDGYYGDDCSFTDVCSTNPCLNGGRCQNSNGNVTCLCPSTHRGEHCEVQCNICLYLPYKGVACAGRQRTREKKWFFDKFTQTCKPMTYAGCGGNSNRFSSRQDCRQRCIVGACCLHSASLTSTTMCRFKSLGQCKRINNERSDVEVTGFRPGLACARDTCGSPDKCMVGGISYNAGEVISLGCNRMCMCLDGGVLDCPCIETSIRKEIRQLTPEELTAFQNAVRDVKMMEYPTGGNAWDAMRDEYMYRAPISQSNSYFLLWNRAFLRRMELLLQKTNCRVTIPYYDFTMDAGRFNESIVWQPNYFGGNGQCVPDHPFRVISGGKATMWEPCLVRDFNESVSVPNMVDVAMAITSSSSEDLGANLLSISSYVRAFVGGDMATSAGAYDPLFYSVHAYIDNLFAQWQRRHPDIEFPPSSENLPFGMPVSQIWIGACSIYASMGYQEPCNVSNSSPHRFGEDGYNLQGYNREGFNRRGFDKDGYNAIGRDRSGRTDPRMMFSENGYNAEGYNRAGLDRRGFNSYGYCDGFSRDGYDNSGYDRNGYNRYGINRSGYDKRGYNIYGVSDRGEVDDSGFYDSDTGFSDCCFSRDGLTVSGLDRYGFSAARYNAHNCNYFFDGPHSLHYQDKLWEILSIQPRSFLASLQRTCGPLSGQSLTYVEQNWITHSNQLPALPLLDEPESTFSKRFCFDTEVLLSWCPCLEGNYPAVCYVNPCQNARCPLHPSARCHINVCGSTCSAEYFLNGRRVNCEDPCLSNPCANGGSCVPYRFSSASERFRCQCRNGYSGPLCDRQASDTCMLPVLTGRCQGRMTRWYFDKFSHSCEQFEYTGCGGNMNNFPNQKACELRCSIGSCCYRRVGNASMAIGFDRDGYDKYGFNQEGFDRKGRRRSPLNSLPHGSQVLGPKGFGHDGYNIYGFNEEGCDRQGYDKRGFHVGTGYNRTGYNKYGRFDDRTGFDEVGLNSTGYTRDGFLCNGLTSSGFNHLGFYKNYIYNCESLSQTECDGMAATHEVIAFSLGRSCEDVQCGDKCGCDFNGQTFKFGETFQHGCKQCSCTLGGTVDCLCQNLGKRKEIRDLTPVEKATYDSAVQKLYESGQWDYFVGIHSEYMPLVNGEITSLPWHRYFLADIERELQKVSDCNVFVPYFDWTIDVGSLNESYAWSVAYFGGNGESETNCVNYHPFQGGDRWHPCVRRHFDTAISLPDAVDFHLLLKETDFLSFSLQLQAMSALFHVWVGGHMASPFSPYDPVFLSHWAFMDHIWTEWQKLNPEGMPRFPIEHHYIQLKPFDVTPDDVLSSQRQICVTYIPPTLGAPCNKSNTRRPLQRNDDGFDRHGYDIDGYDIEGFNKRGVGRFGQRDNRDIFNRDDYSSEGYHRSGFDPQGWDRFGFNEMNFNRDGIDIEGYDKFGFDSYGYDREQQTPFGLFRNGSFASGADRGYANSLFDRYGYNRFGFNAAGLDYNGYSAYGFNTRGYDQDNCNYYNAGPHYMRFFFFGLMQLKNMQVDALKHVKRLCSPISSLPMWISDGWFGNSERIQQFERLWAANRMIDSNYEGRTSSVTGDRLWIPLTPDKQFCFDLHMFTGCPIGTPLIDCPADMCSSSRCASHPRAMCRVKNCGSCYPEYFDGVTGEVFTCFGCIDTMGAVHGEASTWDENCQSCICQGGMILCNPVMCPSAPCAHPATTSSRQCCPVCEACEYEGSVYQDRQEFRVSECEVCRCARGSVTCRPVTPTCPQLTCSNPIQRDGECCMSCPNGCEGHREGEEWSIDACRQCRCIGNTMRCQESRCPTVRCSHPHKRANGCCAECRDCEYNGRTFMNGQQFPEDACTQCTCTLGNVRCTKRRCPPLRCVNQETAEGSCCPVCAPGCEFEGNTYRNGEMFRPSGSPCRNCTCQNNRVQCQGQECHSMGTCPRPVKRSSEQCCPECTDCTYGDRVYRNRQVWTAENGCEKCTCVRGNIECANLYSCERSCTHGIMLPSQCCSECSRCTFASKVYRDGEGFDNPNNPCQRCACLHGNITCDVVPCPTLQCRLQHTKPGDCCPSCMTCKDGSVEREHRSSWRLKSDACTTCSCDEGQIRCRREQCSPANCQYPINIPNTCCPSCAGCLYNGVQFADGVDVPSGDNCRRCQCVRGNVACRRQGCEELTCLSHVTLPGKCCPSCSSCTYEQQQFDEGATFLSPRNPCLRCTCEGGETTCKRIDLECPELSCSHPGRAHGTCCATCDNCQYERRSYRNGETFTPPGSSPCFTCTCRDGVVSCETETCAGISCRNPVSKPDQCCRVCEECLVDGVSYGSGDSWSSDPCTSCSCDNGRINCLSMDCSSTDCTHPSKLPNECCPTCDMCMIDGRIMTRGQRFPHPDDKCRICRCESGNILCDPSPCEPPSCAAPVTLPGSCCPSCTGHCLMEPTRTENPQDAVEIENGMSVPHPEDPCQVCTCTDGALACQPRCASRPPCRHPTDGECCRDNCDGCYFRGRNYYNGEEFTHARDKCRICTCMNGNVRCLRQRCSPLRCDNPQLEEGTCCPVCPATRRSCDVEEGTVPSGQQFVKDCQVCRCDDGVTDCRPKTCPPVQCAHPAMQGCCRQCDGCTNPSDGLEYRNGDAVANSASDPCQTCRCTSGEVRCASRSCSPVGCTHPTNDGCCPVCNDGCAYDGQQYHDGERFNSSQNSCDECVCSAGSVTCQRRSCAALSCTHPITSHDSCCLICGGDCLFENDVYTDGFTFRDRSDSCRECSCTAGSIVCRSKSCSEVSCRNPSIGDCNCATCIGCNYNGVNRRNREKFANPEDEQCSECYCQDGNVNCGRRHCRSSACTHPTLDRCDCPVCDSCLYHGETYRDGEEFMDLEDTCNSCTCEEGNVVCESRACVEVECINPSINKCGCPLCLNCNYLGVEYENNELLIDSMNKCNQCICKSGTVQCAHRVCPPVHCSNPVSPFGECCPKCVGECVVEGDTYDNGAVFSPLSDPCSTCTCRSGDVRCLKQRCERRCTHPITSSQCCPDCSGCLYQGRLLNEGESFTPNGDPCQRCSCLMGSVLCRDRQCPPLECSNPRRVRGQCCPECPEAFQRGCTSNGQVLEVGSKWIERGRDSCSECLCTVSETPLCTAVECDARRCEYPVPPTIGRCCAVCEDCYYLNHTYTDGEVFHPNTCQDCVCRKGNVQCVTKACRPLTCPVTQQVQTENDCCPRCVSCSTDNHLYAENEVWSLDDDQCVTCQCHQGVVTCQPMMCLPACQIRNHLPGQCCPVCSGCRYGSKVYEIGDHFEPNPMNPCEVCECVEDEHGAPALSCNHVACPSLANCPRSCISQPEPGSCCPTCTNRPDCAYGNCNAGIRDQLIHPFANPCFSCQCNSNDTWECAPMTCRKLDCPLSEQYTPKASCCPICDTCHIAAENRDVANGYTWRIGECQSCHCDHGSIMCTTRQCEVVNCVPSMIPYKPTGQCCQQCADPQASCVYEGHSVPSQHRWLVDKCTTCRCFAGKISCATQRCRMLMCDATEVATVIPGECCARCLPQPGTCIAFGDPHYRTFDGRMVHFQGKCKYLLTSDCMKGDFRVEVQNKALGESFGDVTWTDKVFFTVSGHRVLMNSDDVVSINETTVQLPILIQPYLFIDKTGSHVLVSTQIGVRLSWNAAQRHLEVHVPGSYKRRTCGLCGNFNNYPQDDLRFRNSRMTSSDTTFGNHWKVRVRGAPVCEDANPYDPCDSLPYTQRKKANTACKIIRTSLFAPCHQVVNPEMYFSACVQDVCACGENNRFCLCDALEAYASQCRRAGVVVRWRSNTLCAISCHTERGYVFDECGSPCKRTCANRNLPPEEIDRQCFMPCVSGCQCVAGKVEHEGRCINPTLCPDNISTIELTQQTFVHP